MQKQAPLSPPKMSRKRVHAVKVTQTLAGSQVQGSQVGSGNVGSMERSYERCIKHQIQCVVVGGGVRCENCWVLTHASERGGRWVAVGSQMKWKARKPVTLGKRPKCLSFTAAVSEPGKSKVVKHFQAVNAASILCLL